MASSPFLVTKVKTSFQPGSDITSIADTIGSILIQDPNFVNALAAAFTGSELVANTERLRQRISQFYIVIQDLLII